LICPECGSNEPRNAKYCGICGAPLTQESRVNRFLKGAGDDGWEIELPQGRRPLFYILIALGVVLCLAVVAGLGLLAWELLKSDGQPAQQSNPPDENALRFENAEYGVNFLYPKLWVVDEGEKSGTLLALSVRSTSTRWAALTVMLLPPEVSVGGFEGIEDYVRESLEKELGGSSSTTSGSGKQATGQSGTPALERTDVNGVEALFARYEREEGDGDVTYERYWVAPSELLYSFTFRAPTDEWSEVATDFSLIIQTFRSEEVSE
jgi:hypothetical protein